MTRQAGSVCDQEIRNDAIAECRAAAGFEDVGTGDRLVTTSSAVRGSKPQPPDAKLTPVRRSKSLSSVPRYAGTYSLMPSLLAAPTQ
jgi:hypothetical protein